MKESPSLVQWQAQARVEFVTHGADRPGAPRARHGILVDVTDLHALVLVNCEAI